MTEIGMALTNPYYPTYARIPGHVGRPFPNVEVRIQPLESEEEAGEGEEETKSGELLVRGPQVFLEYFGKEVETRKAFVDLKDGGDAWFVTGDVVEVREVTATIPSSSSSSSLSLASSALAGLESKEGAELSYQSFRILGRRSVDILKSGGFKISALDVEQEFLCHPNIRECAIVGIEDLSWGQILGIIVVLKKRKEGEEVKGKKELDLEELREWAKDKLASYKLPRRLLILEEIPRNAMGKMNKKQLVKLFQ
jgi:malonyl-CoA/methylmalonyl-CoA synthetase